jgi:hypothetical protein
MTVCRLQLIEFGEIILDARPDIETINDAWEQVFAIADGAPPRAIIKVFDHLDEEVIGVGAEIAKGIRAMRDQRERYQTENLLLPVSR